MNVQDALILVIALAATCGIGFVLMYRHLAGQVSAEKSRCEQVSDEAKRLNAELFDARALIGRIEAIEDERNRLSEDLGQLRSSHDEVSTRLAQEREARSQQEAAFLRRENQLVEDENRIREAMTVLAKQVVDENSSAFLKQAADVLGNLSKQTEQKLEIHQRTFEGTLLPLKESLKRIDEQAQNLESARQKAFGEIAKGLEQVVSTTQSVAKEAGGLKDALRKPHVRGRWGEAQLQNCMELAGMSEHCDLTFQHTFDSDEGRIVPDMTVKMPGGRVIVVDAKTPRDAFDDYIEATDEDRRRAALLRHGKQVLSHVEALAKKEYGIKREDSPDFVVMFLPNESFLYAALEGQPNLVETALAKRILIASPPTLVGLLKVIRYGWMETRLAEDAQKIAKEGAALHKRIADLMSNFSVLGKSLDKAKGAFDSAAYNLNSRVLPTARRLESMGASNGRSLDPLPAGILPLGFEEDGLPLAVVEGAAEVDEAVDRLATEA